jgi:hypothetical protein
MLGKAATSDGFLPEPIFDHTSGNLRLAADAGIQQGNAVCQRLGFDGLRDDRFAAICRVSHALLRLEDSHLSITLRKKRPYGAERQ